MSRRTLIIIASIIVLLGLLIGAYFLFFSGKPSITTTAPSFTAAGNREPVTNTVSGPVEGAGTVVAPHLVRITPGPVAKGAIALVVLPQAIGSSTPGLGDTEVRYVERQSGNVYSFLLHDRVLTRTGNKTLPGIQEAVWLPDGSSVFARFVTVEEGVDRVATYSLPSGGGEGFFLESGLSSVGVTASSSVYTLISRSAGSVATIANANGTGARTLFSSPLQSLTLRSFGSNFIATTKASSEISGYSFLVSGKTGGFSRILGPFTGLSTLPNPTGKFVLYSYTSRGKVFTAVLDVDKHTATQLPVTTLAEKCVWAPNGTVLYCGVPTALSKDLPDSWYQGAQSLSDRLWKVDLNTRLATLITDPTTVAGITIDMVALTIDPAEDAVIFTNKSDGSLWAYDF